ncbi:hypothetical protein PFISCL1PPCAC_26348, partial [Pristionchus fissidentatus]
MFQVHNRSEEQRKEIIRWNNATRDNSDDTVEELEMDETMKTQSELEDHHPEEYEITLDNCMKEFKDFLELNGASMDKCIAQLAGSCKEKIDSCLLYGTSNSKIFIQELREFSEVVLNSFQKSTRDNLSRICVKVQHALNRVKNPMFTTPNAEFMHPMEDELKRSFQMIRKTIDNHIVKLSDYRKVERRETELSHKKALIENESQSLHEINRRSWHYANIPEIPLSVSRFPEINLEDYVGVPLGSGGEGDVFRYDLPGSKFGKKSDQCIRVAAKKFQISHFHRSDETRTDISRGNVEVMTLLKLENRNIVSFLGRGSIGLDRYLLMEYCPYTLAGEIDDRRNTFLDAQNFLRWASGITEGMKYVHEQNICHGDLKPANILIGENGQARIADFGLTSPTVLGGNTMTNQRGTLRYMAPEQHNGTLMQSEEFKKCDVWSYGIVLWEMITCQSPFECVDDVAIPLLIGKDNEHSHPAFPDETEFETLENLLR